MFFVFLFFLFSFVQADAMEEQQDQVLGKGKFSAIRLTDHPLVSNDLSRKFYRLSEGLGSRNFSNVTELFKDVTFEPPHEGIDVIDEVSSNGSIALYFKDLPHLISLHQTAFAINSKEMYFIKNPAVNTEDIIVSIDANEKITLHLQFHIKANTPLELKVKGEFYIPGTLIWPAGSHVVEGRGIFENVIYENDFYIEMDRFINTFKKLNTTNIRAFTSKARQILLERNIERHENPKKFPKFSTLCPNVLISTDQALNIKQVDHIDLGEKNKPIYVMSSLRNLNYLKMTYPTMSSYIFVDPSLNILGIYGLGEPLCVKGFYIRTQGNLAISGFLHLPDYYDVKISSAQSLWHIALNPKFRGKLKTFSAGNFYSLELYNGIKKPDEMPVKIWNELTPFWDKHFK